MELCNKIISYCTIPFIFMLLHRYRKREGVNDAVSVDIGGKTISSDSMTPEGYTELAEKMKRQETPEYANSKEKLEELSKELSRQRKKLIEDHSFYIVEGYAARLSNASLLSL